MGKDDTPRLRAVVAERASVIRLDISEMLAMNGYVVVADTPSINEAAALTIVLRPDLLILDEDLIMPNTVDPILMLQRTQFPFALVEPTCDDGNPQRPAMIDQRRVRVRKPFSEQDLLSAATHALRVAAYSTLEHRTGIGPRRPDRVRPVNGATANSPSERGRLRPDELDIAG